VDIPSDASLSEMRIAKRCGFFIQSNWTRAASGFSTTSTDEL